MVITAKLQESQVRQVEGFCL